MDAQLKKGVLEMCILHCISEDRKYGYDIIQSLHAYFPEVNDSTFYAILRRLNTDGEASITYGEASGGPPRKYYSLTVQGKDRLMNAVSEWRRISCAVTKIGIK